MAQRWEHALLTANFSGLSMGQSYIRLWIGQEQRVDLLSDQTNWRAMLEVIEDLGAAGWEAVSMAPQATRDYSSYSCLFKRPLE